MLKPTAAIPCLLLAVLSLAGMALRADEVSDTVGILPENYRDAVRKQLGDAGENQMELLAALRAVKPEHRGAMAFLLANMPRRDLVSLGKNYLVANVEYAYRARAAVPWGPALSDEIFLNGVLPYASVNERRDDWRKDFFDRFIGVARRCKTPGEAAVKLNKLAFEQLKVRYHATRRPKPDQSPYESIEAGYASCTGLSVLLVDACRAVAVPARLVGTPQWTDRSGNHSWVEVWDGQWRYTGAAEPAALDKAWFTAKAARADPSNPIHRIYAASFRRTETSFPLVWDRRIRYVRAVDVTPFYTTRCRVTFHVTDRPGGQPVKARLAVRLAGRLVAQGSANGTITFILAGGQTYEVRVQRPDGSEGPRQVVSLGAADNQVVDVVAQTP